MLKEIKEDLNKWKDMACSWTKRLHTFKTLSELIHRFNALWVRATARARLKTAPLAAQQESSQKAESGLEKPVRTGKYRAATRDGQWDGHCWGRVRGVVLRGHPCLELGGDALSLHSPLYRVGFKTLCVGSFPGGPVVEIPCSQCRGSGFDPCLGN